MVNNITSKPVPLPMVGGGTSSALRSDAGSVQASQDAANVNHLTPIPKADIKVDPDLMRRNLEDAIKQLNDMMQAGGRGLNFSMDQKLGMPIVVVKNSQTGEVVRQIPNEVVVRVAHSIEDFKGMLHNAIA